MGMQVSFVAVASTSKTSLAFWSESGGRNQDLTQEKHLAAQTKGLTFTFPVKAAKHQVK